MYNFLIDWMIVPLQVYLEEDDCISTSIEDDPYFCMTGVVRL